MGCRVSLRTIREQLSQRVGFWRALGEVAALGSGLALLPYAIFGQTWPLLADTIAYLNIIAYLYGAWRLQPGTGSWPARIGRFLLWCSLLAVLAGIITWLTLGWLDERSVLMNDMVDLPAFASPELIIINAFLFTLGTTGLLRCLIAIWTLGRRRLRWQLTFGALLIAALTNLCLPVVLFATIAAFSLGTIPVVMPLDQAANMLREALATLPDDAEPPVVQAMVEGLYNDTVRFPVNEAAPFEVAEVWGVRRISVLAADGAVIASAGAEALPLATPLPTPLAQAIQAIRAIASAEQRCVTGQPRAGILSDIAICPLDLNRFLLVERQIGMVDQLGASIGRLTASVLVNISLSWSIIAIVIATIIPIAFTISYFFARRLTKRLERLATATHQLAGGQIEMVAPLATGEDEVGQLTADFNAMAAQLRAREQALRAAAERNEQLLAANKRLIANVSHELRNPLATLRAQVEALVEDYNGQLPARELQVIEHELQRLSALIEDLFTLARADANQLKLDLVTVNVADTLQRLVKTYSPLARRLHQIEVVCEIAPEMPPVLTDPQRLEQVLINLVQNALRHTPPGGIVMIKAQREREQVAISVIDTGPGIAGDERELVFERFYRGDASRARTTGGAGLGLAIARELVRAMNGDVRLCDAPGHGACFTVILPAITTMAPDTL
ncbi:HAMP domain-containing sensor histidine kinase [Chloroflexus sp.]|uniref:sensor histidine kinase n=1 Tax=Chloroflexus sp. TaxID=1904827 RepID=UPI002ACDA7C9|nr:HAMP domain-containing sensor histidine kinase [Chloroflexus sp.]